MRFTYIGEVKGKLENWWIETTDGEEPSIFERNLQGTLQPCGQYRTGKIIGCTADKKYVVCGKGNFYRLGEQAPEFLASRPDFKEKALAALPVFDFPEPEMNNLVLEQ